MSDFKVSAKINGANNKASSASNNSYVNLKYEADSVSFSGLDKKKKDLAKRISAFTGAVIVAITSMFGFKSCDTEVKAPTSQTQQAETPDEQTILDHIHAATVITTPHKTANYVYVPKGGTNIGDTAVQLKIDDNDTLYTVVNDNFAQINDENVYSVALDQAKANSELVLGAVNSQYSKKYEDVAEIPKDELLDAFLNPKNEEKTIDLVNSTHEDFLIKGDGKSEIAYVNQENFVPDNEYVVIDPNWDEKTPDAKGRPIYKSVEEAILDNYRSQKIEGDDGENKLIESRWTDSYTNSLDTIRDDEENMAIFQGMSRDEAMLMLRETDFEDKMVLHLSDFEAQRISIGCDEHGAKENITNGWDYKYSYLQSSDEFADLNLKDENGEYVYKTMTDLMAFYADPSDEHAQNGKSLLDRYNENPDDAETYSYMLAAINNIIKNNEIFATGKIMVDGEEIDAKDLTTKIAFDLPLIDKDGKPITDKIVLGDAAYNIIGSGEAENVYIKVPKQVTPQKSTPQETPPRKPYTPPVEITPEPEPEPEPTPTPTPIPTPEPDPEPTPEPTPDPEITPDPEPDPTPDPDPEPTPDPDPDPTPKPNKPGGGGGGGGGGGSTPTPKPDPDPDPIVPTDPSGPTIPDNPQEGVEVPPGDDDDDQVTTPTNPSGPTIPENPQDGIDTGNDNEGKDDDDDGGIDITPTPNPDKPVGPTIPDDDDDSSIEGDDNEQSGVDIGKPSKDDSTENKEPVVTPDPEPIIPDAPVIPDIDDYTPEGDDNEQSGVDVGKTSGGTTVTPPQDNENSGATSGPTPVIPDDGPTIPEGGSNEYEPESKDNDQSGVEVGKTSTNSTASTPTVEQKPVVNQPEVVIPSEPKVETPSQDVGHNDNSQSGVSVGSYSAPSAAESSEIDDIFHDA